MILEIAIPATATVLGSIITYFVTARTMRSNEVIATDSTRERHLRLLMEADAELRKELKTMLAEAQEKIAAQSKEIAELSEKIGELQTAFAVLKGERCLNFDCPNRLRNNND